MAEDSLNEFDPGEHGISPFTVYVGDTLIDKFTSYDEAQEEVEYQRGLDPRWAHDQWKIVNGIGETVWEYDVGAKSDDMRRQHKIQFIPRDNKDVAEASNTKQRYGQLIIKRAREARAAEAKEKAEQEKAEQEKAEKEKKPGVAEGWKQTLRLVDPTIIRRIRDKSQEKTNDALRDMQDNEKAGFDPADMLAPNKNKDFRDAARYAKLYAKLKGLQGVAEGMFTKCLAIDPTIGKQINDIINRLYIRVKPTKDEYLLGIVQELFNILRNTGGTYSAPGSPGVRDVAEADKKRNPTRDFLRKHPVPDSEMVKPVKKQGNQDAKTSLSHMMGGSSNELMKNLKIKEQGVSEGANYWTKLQDTRSKKINSLVDELEKSIQ